MRLRSVEKTLFRQYLKLNRLGLKSSKQKKGLTLLSLPSFCKTKKPIEGKNRCAKKSFRESLITEKKILKRITSKPKRKTD